MFNKPFVSAPLYEEPACVILGAVTEAVICDSFSDSNVEDYGREEFVW